MRPDSQLGDEGMHSDRARNRGPTLEAMLSRHERELFIRARSRAQIVEAELLVLTAALGRMCRAGFDREALQVGWRPNGAHVAPLVSAARALLARCETLTASQIYDILLSLELAVSTRAALDRFGLGAHDGVIDALDGVIARIENHFGDVCIPRLPRTEPELGAFHRALIVPYLLLDRDPRDVPSSPLWSTDPILRQLKRLDPSMTSDLVHDLPKIPAMDTVPVLPADAAEHRSPRKESAEIVSLVKPPHNVEHSRSSRLVRLGAKNIRGVAISVLTLASAFLGLRLVAQLTHDTDASMNPSIETGASSATTADVLGRTACGGLACDDVLRGNITADRELERGRRYLLAEWVYVEPGAVLTIEKGVTIHGAPSSGLVISQGARIEAVGTPTEPIVFTSANLPGDRKPGDWGGIILLGADGNGVVDEGRFLEFCNLVDDRCATHTYGGDDDYDDSGRMKHIVIAYAGGPILAGDIDVNGFTLGAVGYETELDNIAVVRPGDDCFEFFGGSVEATHLICIEAADDAFDIDQGYDGVLQYLLMLGGPSPIDFSPSLFNRQDEGHFCGIAFEQLQHRPVELAPVIANVTLCADASPDVSVKAGFGQEDLVAGCRTDAKWLLYGAIHHGFAERGALPPSQDRELVSCSDPVSRRDYKPPYMIQLPCTVDERLSEAVGNANCFAGAFRDGGDDWDAWFELSMIER